MFDRSKARGWWLGSLALLARDFGPKPGLELQILVAGNAAPGERAKRIEVVFDRPMVANTVVGQAVALGEGAPFRLQPEVPGTLRWREDRKLSFEPAEPLPRATAFVVTIPKGTRAPDDVGLRESFELRFETERPTLASELVQGSTHADAKQWATPLQRLRLAFNQPVRPAAVAASCQFRSKDGKEQVTTDLSAVADPPREQFEVGPSQPLRAATAWRFGCDASFAPVEGPLGLAMAPPVDDADGQVPTGNLDFVT
jgi:hypothetical protein